jgi:hypothetical protein
MAMKYTASRLSKDNKVFPTEIIIETNGITVRVPGVFNSKTEYMEYSYITNVSVDTPLIGFSTITFYTSGTQVTAHGFTKEEVKQIKEAIDIGKNRS